MHIHVHICIRVCRSMCMCTCAIIFSLLETGKDVYVFALMIIVLLVVCMLIINLYGFILTIGYINMIVTQLYPLIT